MKPAARYDWIEEYLRTTIGGPASSSVTTTDRYFVDDYIEATGAKHDVMPYGADLCPQLARDLKAMLDAGRLRRYSDGIQGMGGMGFPKWTWTYKLVNP